MPSGVSPYSRGQLRKVLALNDSGRLDRQYVRDVVDSAPPLNPDAARQLADLLPPPGDKSFAFLDNADPDTVSHALQLSRTILERQRIREQERRPPDPSLVYFIQKPSGPIKIGVSADPPKRMADLSRAIGEHLEMLATCEGGYRYERELHVRFRAHRLIGEWFEPADELLTLVEEVRRA